MINASNVVSPFSSGLPPKPTVKSHWSCSHVLHPATTASIELAPSSINACHAYYCPTTPMFISGRGDSIKILTLSIGLQKCPCIYHKRYGGIGGLYETCGQYERTQHPLEKYVTCHIASEFNMKYEAKQRSWVVVFAMILSHMYSANDTLILIVNKVYIIYI